LQKADRPHRLALIPGDVQPRGDERQGRKIKFIKRSTK